MLAVHSRLGAQSIWCKAKVQVHYRIPQGVLRRDIDGCTTLDFGYREILVLWIREMYCLCLWNSLRGQWIQKSIIESRYPIRCRGRGYFSSFTTSRRNRVKVSSIYTYKEKCSLPPTVTYMTGKEIKLYSCTSRSKWSAVVGKLYSKYGDIVMPLSHQPLKLLYLLLRNHQISSFNPPPRKGRILSKIHNISSLLDTRHTDKSP